MASAVDICNLALGHLGDEANVSSLTESSTQAEHCARFYPIARDQALASHAWSFATKRVSLALLSTTETPGQWLYAYSLPSKFLQAVAVLPPEVSDDSETEDYIIESLQDGTGVIYTNTQTAVLRYIEQITDTTRFQPLFVIACARLLAAYLAGPIIKGEAGMKVSQAHLAAYTKVDLPAAQAADSRGRKQNLYDTFVPSGIKARA
jgi:hypothetical protein